MHALVCASNGGPDKLTLVRPAGMPTGSRGSSTHTSRCPSRTPSAERLIHEYPADRRRSNLDAYDSTVFSADRGMSSVRPYLTSLDSTMRMACQAGASPLRRSQPSRRPRWSASAGTKALYARAGGRDDQLPRCPVQRARRDSGTAIAVMWRAWYSLRYLCQGYHRERGCQSHAAKAASRSSGNTPSTRLGLVIRCRRWAARTGTAQANRLPRLEHMVFKC